MQQMHVSPQATCGTAYHGRLGKEVEYQQAFGADGRRLCLVCLKEVTGCELPAAAVLPGAVDLFCTCGLLKPIITFLTLSG